MQAGERVNRFVVMSVTLLDEEGINRTETGHVHAVDTILEKYARHQVFFAENRIVALLIATPASFEKYLHILCDDILQSVKRILGLSCCMGVSRETAELGGLNEAYREAVNAMRYAGRTGGGIRYIADEEPFGGTDMEEVMRIAALAEEFLRAGNRDALEELLDREFAKLSMEKTAREKRSYLLLELLSAVCRVQYAVSNETEGTGLSGELLTRQLTLLDRPFPEAAEAFKNFCLMSMEQIDEEKQRSSMDACDRALLLIRSEFDDPEISLVSVSSRIGVSPNYLSALIKKRTGSSFVDYLTGQRMEQARQQLLHTDKKIREISESCGYSDQHYFSYCFKKYEGVSPNAPRRQKAESAGEGV